MIYHFRVSEDVKQRWTFRAYPTPAQEKSLAQVFGCARYIYNWGLMWRKEKFAKGDQPNYHKNSSALTRLKKEEDKAWLNEVSCVPLQQALRDLDASFRNFFDKRAGYPAFRKKCGKQSAEFTTSGMKLCGSRSVYLAKIGNLRFRNSRGAIPPPTSARVIRNPDGRYFVSFCLDVAVTPLPKTGKEVGIDLGISRLATLSDGTRIPNHKFLHAHAKKLARAQRLLSKKTRGSKRREKQRKRVARLHARIADCRKDHLNKVTTDLVRRFDVIYLEELHVRGMTKNHSLARSLSDAALGDFRRMLECKSSMYGKCLVFVDRFFPSSKTCSCCGRINSSLSLSDRTWTCPCGAQHDRDDNAAKNILAEGHSVIARGDLVRPGVRKSARRGSVKREPPVKSGIPRL